jgi:acetylornithine deacetylase/succinyl-diaminopimelate desuccinylase-like protein
MTTPHEYAAEHSDDFLKQLQDLLRIPSVSADRTNHIEDVKLAAYWLATDMRRIGLENVEVINMDGHHPLLYADWLHAGDDAPTVLVYGHYDVQPAAVRDGWDTQPFEPVIKDGKLYARGASDDKGQMFAQLKAAEALLAAGNCPVNLKFIIEGEEEISSAGLAKYVPANRDKLAADVCVLSDTHILSKEQPSIVYALRGLVYWEIEVFGPAADLHSGAYGGAIHNPVQAIAEIVAGLHTPDGRVNVPGFYDDVVDLSPQEREKLKAVAVSEADFMATTGVSQPWGEADYTIAERIGARPTLEIHGIEGGFYGEGQKTVLPARALAKMSSRLVANQDPDKIYALVKARIEALTPPAVRLEMRMLGATGDPALVDINDPALQAAVVAYEQGWGKTPVYVREGGSIPVVADFQRELGIPVILLGFGLNTDGIHGPNEHFHVDMFRKGIDTAIHFHQQVAAQVSTATQ